MQKVMRFVLSKLDQKLLCCAAAVLTLAAIGCTPRTSKPRPEAAQQILKLRGYEFNSKALRDAITASDQTAVIAFLDGGINVNEQVEPDGETALIFASSRGDLAIVKALLARNADPNIADKGGFTALFRALAGRHNEVAELLLAQPNLDLNARGLNKVTALIAYTSRNREDLVTSLVDRGADVRLQDGDGDTALHLAVQNGNLKLTKMFVSKGAPLDVKNKVGGTPLMWAAVFGNEELVKFLLESGADPTIKDSDGMTAASWAVKNKHEELVPLLSAGKGKSGQTQNK
jgi:ankyrin repeat protein